MKSPFAPLALALGCLLCVSPSEGNGPDLEQLRTWHEATTDRILRSAWQDFKTDFHQWERLEDRVQDPEDRGAAETLAIMRSISKERLKGSLDGQRKDYVLALDDLLQSKAREANAESALAARAEIDRIAVELEQGHTGLLERWQHPDEIFLERTWVSPSGTAFTFGKDGAWFHEEREDGDGRVAGTWRRHGQLVISEVEGDPLATRYFRFATEREGWYGRMPHETEDALVPR